MSPFKTLPYFERTPIDHHEFNNTWSGKSEVQIFFKHLKASGSSDEKMALEFITSLLNSSSSDMYKSAFYEYGHMILPGFCRVDDAAKRKYYNTKLKSQNEMMERTWQLV